MHVDDIDTAAQFDGAVQRDARGAALALGHDKPSACPAADATIAMRYRGIEIDGIIRCQHMLLLTYQ